MVDPELDFLQWHDSYLERIVRSAEEIRLEFDAVPIYRKVRPGLWEEESGAVVLALSGAQVECDPPGDERTGDSSWVSDCTCCEPVARYDIQGLSRGGGPGRIAFVMADCSTVSATFEHVRLTVVGPLENVGRAFEGERPEDA